MSDSMQIWILPFDFAGRKLFCILRRGVGDAWTGTHELWTGRKDEYSSFHTVIKMRKSIMEGSRGSSDMIKRMRSFVLNRTPDGRLKSSREQPPRKPFDIRVSAAKGKQKQNIAHAVKRKLRDKAKDRRNSKGEEADAWRVIQRALEYARKQDPFRS